MKAAVLPGVVINQRGKVLGQVTGVGRDSLGAGETICIRKTVSQDL